VACDWVHGAGWVALPMELDCGDSLGLGRRMGLVGIGRAGMGAVLINLSSSSLWVGLCSAADARTGDQRERIAQTNLNQHAPTRGSQSLQLGAAWLRIRIDSHLTCRSQQHTLATWLSTRLINFWPCCKRMRRRVQTIVLRSSLRSLDESYVSVSCCWV
jgi:hypothetical protein